jgi:RNA polymerase sigma-70 factor (ECF subfamily)
VRRARGGDLTAFEDLVRSHQADVYRLALHLVRDVQTAEDVTQDAFVHAYRSLRRFRGGSKFSTWLFRITRNCAIDAIRRRERRRTYERAALAPDEPVEDPALRVALEQAIDGLPPELREPFVLIEVFGLAYGEAASVLGAPVGTLKSRMHRARQALVETLEGRENAGEV